MRIIFSVFQKDKSDLVNHCNHFEAMQDLERQGIDYSILEGVYKGTKELSFETKSVLTGLALARKYDQESVLTIDSENRAVLDYGFRNKINLGQWVETTKDIAEKQDSYSYHPVTNKYFITK